MKYTTTTNTKPNCDYIVTQKHVLVITFLSPQILSNTRVLIESSQIISTNFPWNLSKCLIYENLKKIECFKIVGNNDTLAKKSYKTFQLL